MQHSPAGRHKKIIQWLNEDQLLRIDDLASRLDVSMMTIHRDIRTLSALGLVEKVHGGVRLPNAHTVTLPPCDLCHMPVKKRLSFSLTTEENKTLHACCPHCGLLLLNMYSDIQTALLRDFIYGRIINVHLAYFVIGSRIALCCEPSILAFATQKDAADFQHGYGGAVLNFSDSRKHLSSSHLL